MLCGSVFAPVIEYVVSLVYKLMKAIQSLVYAFSGVNIFAKATASSMNKTAGSAKDTKKSLSSIHSEINNISNKDSNSGSSSVNPNIDLSQVDNMPNSIIDIIKKGNWHKIGVIIGQKLNEAMKKIPWEKIQDGAKEIATNIANFLNGFIATTDWSQVGNTFAQGLNTIIYFGYSFVTTFDWKQFGQSIADFVNGSLKNTDWSTAGKTLGDGIKGILTTIYTTLEEINWQDLARAVEDFITNIDWSGICDALFEGLGAAIGGLFTMIRTWFEDKLDKDSNFWVEKANECGGNLGLGVLKGIWEKVYNIGQWIYVHIFKPFIEGFKKAFGIHSPSTIMEEQGGYIIDGLYNGLSGIWNKVSSIFVNLKERIVEKFTEIKTNLGNWSENTKETIKGWADTTKTKISECWTNASNIVKEKIGNLKTNILTGLENIKPRVSEWGNKIKDNIDSTFSSMLTNATTWGKDLVSNMASGIKSNIGKITNAVSSVASKIKSFLHFSEPDIGPLSNFHTYMPDMIDLMVKGIHNNMDKVTKELEGLTTNMSYTINTPKFQSIPLNANLNTSEIQPSNTIKETLSNVFASNEGNINITIPLTVKVGNEKIGQILLEDLRDMKRQTGKNLEALIN